MENTKIEWATHTFNPWEGCAKVSPGCKNCYAEGQHKLHHAALKYSSGTCWGVGAPRLGKSADNWKKPLKWNREAQAAGIRARVFCASMADVFEGQSAASRLFIGETAQVPTGGGKTRTVTFVDIAVERLRLLRLIYDTPHLDWLLLTKRPENIGPALASAHAALGMQELATDADHFFSSWLYRWNKGLEAPTNVWLGTSVENQEQADIRVPQLLMAPAAVRFLSCEPLLGPVSLDAWLKPQNAHVSASPEFWANEASRTAMAEFIQKVAGQTSGLHWVIVGGESGHHARPMHPDWARDLRDQCQAAGVAFHFKQWGEWGMASQYSGPGNPHRASHEMVGYDGSLHGTHMMPKPMEAEPIYLMLKAGKYTAGRLLDGRTWDEVPTPQPVAP